MGHKLKKTGAYVWGEVNTFKSNPGVGEESKQSVVIFGDMGKVSISSIPKQLIVTLTSEGNNF